MRSDAEIEKMLGVLIQDMSVATDEDQRSYRKVQVETLRWVLEEISVLPPFRRAQEETDHK